MDSFGQKTNAGINYPSFQRLNVTFRVMEVCVFLIIVSRFTTHLLDTIKLSGDYIWGLVSVRPLFVFLTVNTIVIVLFLKSRQPKKGTHQFNPITDDLHDDYAKNCEEKSLTLIRSSDYDTVKEKKKISRSRSQIFKDSNHHHKESCRELRRSLTSERRLKQGSTVDYCEEEKWVAQNEMSNEQFKQKIEAFIARQQRVLREEEEEDE